MPTTDSGKAGRRPPHKLRAPPVLVTRPPAMRQHGDPGTGDDDGGARTSPGWGPGEVRGRQRDARRAADDTPRTHRSRGAGVRDLGTRAAGPRSGRRRSTPQGLPNDGRRLDLALPGRSRPCAPRRSSAGGLGAASAGVMSRCSRKNTSPGAIDARLGSEPSGSPVASRRRRDLDHPVDPVVAEPRSAGRRPARGPGAAGSARDGRGW